MGIGIKFIPGGTTSMPGIPKVSDAVARAALTPTDGDFVIQLDTDELYYWDGAAWIVYADDTDHAALVAVVAGLAAHLADATDAHDASAISFVAGGTIAATDVQAAISEVASDAATDLSNHLTDATDAHDASAISFAPTGTIASTDAQAAIAEVSGDVEGIKMVVQANSAVNNAATFAPANARRQVQQLSGNGGAVTLADIGVATAQEGDELLLLGTSDSNTVTLVSATNTKLNGTITLANDVMISLVYANSKWRELGRSL
jgi:hypothetical protein